MATFSSYTSPFPMGATKENLESRINLLSQMETPFYSSIGRGTTTSTTPQLIQEELNSLTLNAQVEGFDFTDIDGGDAGRLVTGNARRTYATQIFAKTVDVTGSEQSVDMVTVTGKKELAEQLALRGMEMKRDVEWNCVGDKSAGDGTTNDNGVVVTTAQRMGYAPGNGNTGSTAARQITDYLGQVAFDSSSAGTGAVAGKDGTCRLDNGNPTQGTPRALMEADVNAVARKLYESGGLSYNMGNSMVKNANILLMSPVNKGIFDGILDAKSNTRRDIGGLGDLQGISFTKYGSSFGDFMIVPDNFMADHFVALYNPQNWKWVTLRQMHTQEIAKIGDNERRQLVMEGTLIHRHTAASGAILGLDSVR